MLDQVFQALCNIVLQPARPQLACVVGPTGVGKTVLQSRLVEHVTRELLADLEADPGRIAMTGIEVMSKHSGHAPWRRVYVDSLRALHDPFLPPPGPGQLSPPAERRTEEMLLDAFEETLRQRRPIAFNFDEAQHLARASGGRSLQDQFDVLKSHAERSRVLLILFGTRELLAFRSEGEQVARRAVFLHFPRYRIYLLPGDVAGFGQVVLTFDRQFPCRYEPKLTMIGSAATAASAS